MIVGFRSYIFMKMEKNRRSALGHNQENRENGVISIAS